MGMALRRRCARPRDVVAKPSPGFFLQAEDGIRDYKVTGVQACALPIPPIMNLPRCTTAISGQPFEQSRNDVPGAGVCARAGGKVVIQPYRMHETMRRMSIRLVMEPPPTSMLG